MIPHHRAFFYTRPMRLITVTVLMGYLGLLFLISQYEEEVSFLLYFEDLLSYEYQLQAFLSLKLLLVIMISFGWMYATRWNQYDPLLWIRSSVVTVSITRFLVLLEWSVLVGMVGTMMYLAVYQLYPYDIAVVAVVELVVSVLVFILYYNALCFLLERIIKHLFGLIIPVIFYLVVLLQTDVLLDTDKVYEPLDLIQIIVPDIAITDTGYGFLFGSIMVLSVGVLWTIIALLFVQKQDAI